MNTHPLKTSLTYPPTDIIHLMDMHIHVEEVIAKAKAGSTQLDLGHSRLSNIPPSVFELPHLQQLYLYGNNLPTIPETISLLTSLTKLSLYDNPITTLPHSISTLVNLRMLSLINNLITSLPYTISSLTNLEELYLNSNPLVHIPRGMSLLTNLQYLYLHTTPTLKYPPHSVIGDHYGTVATEVKEYLSTHPNTFTRRGRRDHLWDVIRLMYIGSKDDNCISFNMIPREVIVKIEYFVLCDPYVPTSSDDL